MDHIVTWTLRNCAWKHDSILRDDVLFSQIEITQFVALDAISHFAIQHGTAQVISHNWLNGSRWMNKKTTTTTTQKIWTFHQLQSDGGLFCSARCDAHFSSSSIAAILWSITDFTRNDFVTSMVYLHTVYTLQSTHISHLAVCLNLDLVVCGTAGTLPPQSATSTVVMLYGNCMAWIKLTTPFCGGTFSTTEKHFHSSPTMACAVMQWRYNS